MNYRVTFSCNPNNLTPAACSTRNVTVNNFSEIPAACKIERQYAGPVEDVTIVSLSLIR